MDQAGVNEGKSKKAKNGAAQKLIKCIALIFLASVFFIACGSAPVENKNAAAKSPTPIPPPPERIEKATNVSFSTYSKEWPVGWQWIDPDEKYAPTPHDVKKGVLRVNLTTKKNLNGRLTNAPRYIKSISGDFQIETRVTFNPKENYQGAGLLIYHDQANYMRFERAYGGEGGGASGIQLKWCFRTARGSWRDPDRRCRGRHENRPFGQKILRLLAGR